MKSILLALFTVASAVPVPDDDVKVYLTNKARLAPVVYKPEKFEVKIPDLSSDDVYVTLSEPKRYVEVKKPVIKQPVYKEFVYKKPVVEYELKKAKVVAPEFRAVPAVKTYSSPIVYKQPIYYDD